MRNELKKMLLSCYSYREEPFKLASGQLSNHYINCRPVALNHRGCYLIGALMWNELNKQIEAVGGITFGADPLAVSVMLYSHDTFQQVNAFSIRKELKDHGIPNWIEGDLKPGTCVAIIDDVVTTGNSTISAIERATKSGLAVRQVLILVDREEGGIDAIRKTTIAPVTSLYTLSELLK